MDCQYGCNNKSNFILKNGKNCCSDTYNKCPNLRRKNSEKLKLAYKEGRKNNNHWNKETRGWRKGKNSFSDKRICGNKNLFTENSNSTTGTIKKILIKEKLKKYECIICKNNGSWNEKELMLELDHINGKRKDNRLENLRFLCPNCHSQTSTFKGRNINKNKKIEDSVFIEALKREKNIRQALISLDLDPKGGNYKRGKRLLAYVSQLVEEIGSNPT